MPLWVPPIPRWRPASPGQGPGPGQGQGPGKKKPGQGQAGGFTGVLPWWESGPSADWREIGPVRRRASVTLAADGTGSIPFSVYSANHKWIIWEVVVNAGGATPAIYPQVTLHVGGQAQAGLSEGASWLGNQETFQGRIEMTAADDLSVDFAGGVAGTVMTAIIEGTNYLWR
jgi:hypothetical protein